MRTALSAALALFLILIAGAAAAQSCPGNFFDILENKTDTTAVKQDIGNACKAGTSRYAGRCSISPSAGTSSSCIWRARRAAAGSPSPCAIRQVRTCRNCKRLGGDDRCQAARLYRVPERIRHPGRRQLQGLQSASAVRVGQRIPGRDDARRSTEPLPRRGAVTTRQAGGISSPATGVSALAPAPLRPCLSSLRLRFSSCFFLLLPVLSGASGTDSLVLPMGHRFRKGGFGDPIVGATAVQPPAIAYRPGVVRRRPDSYEERALAEQVARGTVVKLSIHDTRRRRIGCTIRSFSPMMCKTSTPRALSASAMSARWQRHHGASAHMIAVLASAASTINRASAASNAGVSI